MWDAVGPQQFAVGRCSAIESMYRAAKRAIDNTQDACTTRTHLAECGGTGTRICLKKCHERIHHEVPEAALLHIAAYLYDVAVICRTAMEDKVIQHMDAVLSEAGLVVNTKTSLPDASGNRRNTHDGFVLLGIIVQSEEEDEYDDGATGQAQSHSWRNSWHTGYNAQRV